MATPTTIITASLRHLGVIGAADTSPEPEDSQLCLDALKSMLDAWNLSPQNSVGLQEVVFTPSAGSQSFTIGPASDIVLTNQPKSIVKALYRQGGTDWPVDVLEVSEYAELPLKANQSTPCVIALNRGVSVSTVYMYPAANGTAQLRLWVATDVVSSFASLGLTTTLTLPNGYQNALEWCLAEEVSDSFDVASDKLARVIRKAGIAHRRIKRTNSSVPHLDVMGGQREYDIESDR